VVRVKSKWNQKDRNRSITETAGAMGFILWRIAQQGVLNLENEGFQTDTNAQRLDVMAEFLAFLLHLVDRRVVETMEADERPEFVTALAKKLADFIQENRGDASGKGEYRQDFIKLLNERTSDYADFSVGEDGTPGYAFKRYFGENVRTVMGEKDNQWITDQVMEIEVPETLKPLKKAVNDLLINQ
jgi:hypothetical protein